MGLTSPADPVDAELSCSRLTKVFVTGTGIFDIDLSVRPGEVVGFVGPNGAGKTTTIRCILGLLIPDRGEVGYAGVELTSTGRTRGFSESARRGFLARVGYVPSELEISGHVKLSSYLELVMRVRRRRAGISGTDDLAARAGLLARNLNLDLERRFGELSRGTRQKFAVLLAWFFDPGVLLLDEPTTGLDPLAQEQIHDLVRVARAEGKGILYSSHNLNEIEELCDRVILIRDGRVAAQFEMERLKAPLPWRFTLKAGADLRSEIDSVEGVSRLVEAGPEIRFDYSGNLPSLLALLGRHDVADLEVTKPGLEEVVIDYYKGRESPESEVVEGVSEEAGAAHEASEVAPSWSAAAPLRVGATPRQESTAESGLVGMAVPWIFFWMRVRRRVLGGWMAAIGGLAALTVALYPAFRSNEALLGYTESLPPEMLAFFGFQGNPQTYGGWLALEVYSNYMAATFAFFAVFAGAGSVSGLIRRGEAEVLFSLPLPRWYLFLGGASEVLIGAVSLCGILFVVTVLGDLAFEGELGLGFLLGGALNLAALTLTFGAVALTSGSAFRSYGAAVGTAAAVVGTLFLWNGIASLADRLTRFRFVSPFYHYSPGTISGTRWGPLVVQSGLFVIGLVLASVSARRKEVCA